MKIKISRLAFASVLGVAAASAQAVALNGGARLSITSGVEDGNHVTSGSWFEMVDEVQGFNVYEALSQGTEGLVIGYGSLYNPSAITAVGSFFGYPSANYLTAQITGGTSGLDMSGWVWSWDGHAISMASGAWGAGYTDGVANLVWDGIDEHAYMLDYHATVPAGDPYWGGIQYALHLEGCVALAPESMCVASPTPEANTWVMMLAGLGLIGATVRYRKR